MNHRLIIAAAAACLAPTCAAFAATPVDREIDADATGTLEVQNVSGSIEVRGGSRGTVHVTGTLADNVERLDVTRDGDRVRVDVVLRKNSHSGSDDEGTALTIDAPQGSRLRVSTVSSSVKVHGIEGEQELSSVSGHVDTDAVGDLTLSTVSGSVSARSHGADAVTRAHTVSGSLELAGVSGEIRAEAVSGSVRVVADKIGRAQVNTISGHASLHGALADDARVELTSTSGTVEMLFTGKAEADYELRSFSGQIKSCFGPPPTESRNGPQREQRFREGASSARVEAQTMSGRIDLCRE
jgi:DUF4097 and DUF4098 domain-containing protein YvlB